MFARTGILGRNVAKSLVRFSHDGGIPGGNLPFDIHNRTKFTVYFTVFCALGVGAPFFVLRHQLLKK